MKNSKQPINPIWMTKNGEESYIPLKEGQKTGYEKMFTGLSKREYFAAMAMQGWIACNSEGFSMDAKSIAERSIMCADEILKQLES